MSDKVNTFLSVRMDRMREELTEGDFGGHFARWARINPEAAEVVIRHAVDTFAANRSKWDNAGQFALNYLTTALRIAEAHTPDSMESLRKAYPSHEAATVAQDGHYDTLWETWAEFVISLTTGE